MSIQTSYAISEVLTVVLLKAQNYIPHKIWISKFPFGHYTALKLGGGKKKRKLGGEP